MPVRLSSMEVSDAESESHGAGPRRRSGRVAKKAAASSPASSAKRKRDDADNVDDVDMDDVSESEDDESEGEPDEEELREKRRRAKKKSASGKQPTAKKPKPTTNGAPVSLAIRPAASSKRKAPAKKRTQKDATAEEAGGIYGNALL